MEGFDPRTSFGYDESKRYDAVDTRGDEEQTVAFLAQLAGQRAALEFAVGTGRIALPLVNAGVRVDGIELSQDMVDRMREKPDGNNVTVTMGDMSRVTTGRTYGLVYLVYNTIGNLLTQDGQVRCFQNAAQHLTDDGVFVLECRVPTAPSRPGHQYVDAEHIGVDHVVLDVCRYDPVTQILDENHVRIGAEGLIFSPIRLRLADPPEFDLMARIAGLRLRERWGAGTASRTPPAVGAMSASTSDRTTGDNRPFERNPGLQSCALRRNSSPAGLGGRAGPPAGGCSRCQTPARCQSPRRRQQVTGLPQPSWRVGSSRQGMPVRSW
jgi:SAM-dependent methyltransferase